jgi:hypothetical protein
MPPKIEILVFFKKKILCVEEVLEYMFTVWNFNTIIFYISFLFFKKWPLYVNFNIPLVENDFFSQCSTPLVGMRF